MTGDAGGETAYHAPDSVAAAHRRLARAPGEVHVVAGGQTLSLLVREGLVDADALVDVAAVPALSGVALAESAATVGAATTYAALADHALSDRAALLGDVCSVLGDRQVRNAGTVGGAVCYADPSLDVVPALLCLDATCRVGSVGGRRRVSLADFLLGRGRTALGEAELLEALAVDLPDERTGTAYEKHAAVEAGWTTAGAATRLTVADGTVTDARVALSAVAETAVRAERVEAELLGGPATREAIAAASEAVAADVDPVPDRSGASPAYKRAVAPTVVERSLARAARRARGGGSA